MQTKHLGTYRDLDARRRARDFSFCGAHRSATHRPAMSEQQGSDSNDWISTTEAGEILGIHPSNVRKRINHGTLRSRSEKGHCRVLRSEVEQLRDTGTVTPPSETSRPISVATLDALAVVSTMLGVDDWSELPPLLRPNDVAKLLRVDPRSVRASISNGSLPSVQIGRRKQVPTLAIISLLTQAA